MTPAIDDRGLSLIEALIASALIATALVALSHLLAIATTQTTAARRTMTALVLAQSKLEALRSLPWRFAADGSRTSSEALALSPASSLVDDAGGWYEELDRFGSAFVEGRPRQYRRRWAIARLSPMDEDTLVLQVCVFAPGVGGPDAAADACVAAVRTRKP